MASGEFGWIKHGSFKNSKNSENNACGNGDIKPKKRTPMYACQVQKNRHISPRSPVMKYK